MKNEGRDIVNDETKLSVEFIMCTNVHTVTPEASLGELKEIFERVDYHHLLVQEKGRLMGVVSDRDISRHLSPFLNTSGENRNDRKQLDMSGTELMSTQLITVSKETAIDSASILLLENNISCLPVTGAQQVIEGIVSWKDILQYHVYGVDES